MDHSNELHRRSTRLRGYDYSQPGGYFVTVCTRDKTHILGNVIAESVILSPIGKFVEECWPGIPHTFRNVELDQWIIMPNHLHGIILIYDARRGEAFAAGGFNLLIFSANASPVRQPKGTTPRFLSAIIQNFKSISTRRVNQLLSTPRHPLWQRGYYDRIIRNEKELDRIRHYIKGNPLKWELDPYHPTSH